MSFEIAGFRAYLASQSTITDIVSTRIYPVILPQGVVYPAISYDRVSGVRLHNLSGVSGHGTARMSVNCWADDYDEVKALADTVRVAVDAYRGLMGTVLVRGTHIENEFDLFDDEVDAEGIYRVVQDYMIQHQE